MNCSPIPAQVHLDALTPSSTSPPPPPPPPPPQPQPLMEAGPAHYVNDVQKRNALAYNRNASRVRENQRRARDKRKAYIDELQQKVKNFEASGVQATVDMQRAARTVAQENSRLRMLLRQKGVSEEEVTEFLRSFPDEDVSHQRPWELPTSAPQKGEAAGGCCAPVPVARDSSKDIPSMVSSGGSGITQMDRVSPTAEPSARDLCCEGKTRCTMEAEQTPVPAYTGFATPSLYLSQCDAGSDERRSSTAMSCTAAAKIITDMRGHNDSAIVKQELGCDGREECVVKNTTLFQVLERTGREN